MGNETNPVDLPRTEGAPGGPAGAVAREYRRLARAYDERWAGYLRGTLRMTLRALDPGPEGSVLDVGCGTGLLLEELRRADPGRSLHGVDLSPAMLQVAGERLEGTACLAHASAEALPYGEEVFDAVASASMLHYLGDPDSAVREAHRVLRPGGIFVLTDWCRDVPSMKVLDWWLRRRDPAHGRTLSSRDATALLERSGFRIQSIRRGRVRPLWGVMTLVAVR